MAFKTRRTLGETAQRLSELMNDPRYDRSEVTKPDQFAAKAEAIDVTIKSVKTTSTLAGTTLLK